MWKVGDKTQGGGRSKNKLLEKQNENDWWEGKKSEKRLKKRLDHVCWYAIKVRGARVGERRLARRQARQAKSKKENRYVIKVMNEQMEGGQVLWSARTKGCLKSFNWSIINVLYIYSNLSMQGRFEMEYRLLNIVRYNYRDYNTKLPIGY